jgi:hypothetical protein
MISRTLASSPAPRSPAGDGIAGRGPGYGMASLRVDGGDARAVYNATAAARKIAVEQQVGACLPACLPACLRGIHHRGLCVFTHTQANTRCVFWFAHSVCVCVSFVTQRAHMIDAPAPPAGASAGGGDELPQRPPLHLGRQFEVGLLVCIGVS